MKDNQRLYTSLKEEVEKLLNDQCKLEAEASQKYLAMAAWLDRNGYINAAGYLYAQAEEERQHFLKLFRYITEVGGVAITPEVNPVLQEFNNFKEVFSIALQNEIAVTLAINDVVSKCRELGDYATENFIAYYVAEQREEEKNARRVLELFELIDVDSPTGKLVIDEEIGKLAAQIQNT